MYSIQVSCTKRIEINKNKTPTWLGFWAETSINIIYVKSLLKKIACKVIIDWSLEAKGSFELAPNNYLELILTKWATRKEN